MKLAVIGAGLMGRAAAFDLARAQGVEKVGVFDIDEQLAKEVANKYGDGKATGAKLDAGDEAQAVKALTGYAAAVSCVTYKYNPGLTRAAIAAKCHLVDLGGNNDVVNAQMEMDAEAEKAGVIVGAGLRSGAGDGVDHGCRRYRQSG